MPAACYARALVGRCYTIKVKVGKCHIECWQLIACTFKCEMSCRHAGPEGLHGLQIEVINFVKTTDRAAWKDCKGEIHLLCAGPCATCRRGTAFFLSVCHRLTKSMLSDHSEHHKLCDAFAMS